MAIAPTAFELVLKPLPALDAGALQRLRATLVGELNLTVDEARDVLAGIRAVVCQAENARDLEASRTLLQRLGVEAYITAASGTRGAGKETVLAELSLGGETVPAHEPAPALDAVTNEGQVRPDAGSDALDQISDLFRHLEEACVVGEGAKLLRELPLASYQQRFSSDIVSPDNVLQPRIDPLQSSFGLFRAVSWPEVAFSILFSLALLGGTMWWYS